MKNWILLRPFLRSVARALTTSLNLGPRPEAEQLHLQLGDSKQVPATAAQKKRPTTARRFSR